MKSLTPALTLALVLLPALSFADSPVRISILSILQPKRISITLLSPERAALQTENSQKVVAAGRTISIEQRSGTLHAEELTAATMRYCPDHPCTFRIEVPHQIKRNYQGELTFLSGPSAIDIILQTSQDSLLASMTTSEMGESRNIEALKAFAIVARSFLLAGPRHPSIHADLCDTTHCEVFQAFEPTPEAWSAVKETRDLVLTYKNAPFRTYYSRSCGGKTATYREVWGKESADYPFESVLCPCRNEWSTKLTFEQLQVAIGFPIVQIQQRENRVEFSGVHQTTSLSAEEFRTRIGRALGWNLVRSDWFVTSREDDGLLIQGKGSGHRVGFCQDGADVLALRKKTFLQILQYYFPHTEVRSHTNS